MRDINLDSTIYPRFTTKAFATNIPTTLLGTPVLSVYEENNLTQITAGVSVIVDYDSVTGLNQATIVATTANGYEAGKSYDLVITTGTVDGVSVVGVVVFSFTVGTIADSVWDEILTGATHNIADSSGRRVRNLQEWGSYEGGAIFIDTVNGAAGTTDYESGTILNPVDTITDANTLAASLGLPRFAVAPNSSITFAASQISQVFRGIGWSLAFGGQDISDSQIIGAQSVTGTATTPAGEAHFSDCEFISGTLGQSHFKFCGLAGTLTLSDAANYTMSDCYSQIPGSPTPIIDFGAALGDTGLSMRRYSGGIEVRNYGTAGTDTMSLEGDGQLIIAASCTGGAIYVRGNFKVTDNSSGAVTLVYDDNTTGIALIDDIPTTAEFEVRTPTAAQLAYIVSNSADGLPVTFTGGTTTTAILGNVDGGTASSTDDTYNGRILIFNAGTLNQQATDITDYDGATKTCTITAVTTAVTSSHTANLK